MAWGSLLMKSSPSDYSSKTLCVSTFFAHIAILSLRAILVLSRQYCTYRWITISDVTERITSGRFEEFRNHDWFSTVDWAKIETEQFIEDIAAVNDMMDFRDGQYSPKDEFIVIAAQKQQEALSFADLDEIEPQDQEPLFTLLSWGFQSAMAKLQSGIAITESDIYEEPELVKDNFKFCKYKFQSKMSSTVFTKL